MPTASSSTESSTMNTGGNAIELEGVRKVFGPKVAVDSLDLVIPQGSLIGLIGPNGAGKTTSIRMIMSILFPDSGRIEILGRRSAIESKDRIGYLPEERGLYKKMRVGAFLEYVARLKGVDGGAALHKRIRDWLERVALGDCLRKRSEELSKGMQQKVQFIASVLHEPDLLILDEPFSGLDPVNARLLRGLVDEQHKRGCTLIFSTHQMTQAEALCDRVVMIHQGRKVLDHTLGEIHQRYEPRSVVVDLAPGTTAAAGAEAIRRSLSEQRIIKGVHEVGNSRVVVAIEPVDVQHGAGIVRAIAAGVACTRVELVRPTLEDVFIEIVAGSASTQEEKDELLAMMRASPTSSEPRSKAYGEWGVGSDGGGIGGGDGGGD